MTLEEMRERKRELGYSNETLAEKSGVPLATVQKVLSGTTKNPRQKTVEALAAVLQAGAVVRRPAANIVRKNNPGDIEREKKEEPEIPYEVGEGGFIRKRVDRYDPAEKAYVLREAAVEYGTSRTYTMDDIRALPEEIWAELMDGQMVFRAAPNRTHQRINGGMYYAVVSYLRETGRDCEVYIPPYGVFIWGDESEYLQPDLTVFRDHAKSAMDGCVGAPDWVIEIVSPSTRKNDYNRKLFKYREAGVKLYWIIDPMTEMTLVFQFDGNEETTGLYPFEEEIVCAIEPGLKVRIADML